MRNFKQNILAIAFILAIVIGNHYIFGLNQVTASEITCTGGHPHICYDRFNEDGILIARVYGNKAVIVTGG